MKVSSIFFNPVTNSAPFTAAINTLDWIKTSGVSNAVIRPLNSIRKIAERFNYDIPATSLLGTLFPLVKSTKNLFSFVEMFTKVVDIGRSAQKLFQEVSSVGEFHKSTVKEYFVITTLTRAQNETDESWEKRKYKFNLDLRDVDGDNYPVIAEAYHKYDLLDHAAFVSSAAADWLMSCADWAVFRNPSVAKDNNHWTAYAFPWTGRVLSVTNLFTEGRFLWRAYRTREHANKFGDDIEGTIARQEVIASSIKLAFFASFVALDVLGIMTSAERFKGKAWIERVPFWTSHAQTILMPLAFNWYPKVGQEPLKKQAGIMINRELQQSAQS